MEKTKTLKVRVKDKHAKQLRKMAGSVKTNQNVFIDIPVTFLQDQGCTRNSLYNLYLPIKKQLFF
ncbi:MAG: hypothetical protein OXD32_02800 [Endozoicomonadaceae bacterium]|nr:hypothetical protein [Endozoicomonadaceae bacterium]